jgi:hypothetical protein
MDDLISKNNVPGSDQQSSIRFEAKLKNIILTRLEMLSLEGKERVLDYINSLIDSEEKQLEFQRRQGKLYRFWEEEEQGQQV